MAMVCRSCSAENGDSQRFCGQCGSSLTSACGACGADLGDGQKFCGECGTKVAGTVASQGSAPHVHTQASSIDAAPAVAERRLVSVLFVDLVGFTTLSEGRDPEEVRELLSDYFEQARRVVDRYGGVIEKFIGDAVMAVWGTPTAQADDAERSVRAAIEMVDAVRTLGENRSLPGLAARAGVVTGQVAVTLGAESQGMVAGDIVNTAARYQSVAEPNQVLVDDTTRTASSRSIGYSSAGTHTLKGKAEPVEVFAALSVDAGAGGAQRVDGLEAPFTGRGRELRLVKELFHDSAEQSRARLLSVTGVSGVGKSRLGWEFFKYIDGLAGMNLWHVGRSLSYGDGVAYWSLAEMVRMRFRIVEADPDEVAIERLNAGLEEYISDPEERRWLKPRLAVLLGVADLVDEQPGNGSRDELFAGWRLLFERLAESNPVVMMFEDMHGADDGVLDFIEYLLEWSSQLPIFVLSLARPELDERRPEWTRSRNATSLHLDPLGGEAISDIVDGLVGGLPKDMRNELAERAEGIPVFAIEIVRMLIDRDIVVPKDGKYVLAEGVGSLDSLDVPATLHALVAARLDNLPEAHRWLVSDAAIIGHSFAPEALVAVVAATGRPVDSIAGQLSDLVRKEVFTAHSDPRSPERGQYKFVQKVMRTVAYDTLSRRDRKARHLAVASHLEQTLDADDIAGVLAAHYLDAANAVPDAEDFSTLQDTARRHLIGAARRASSLAATDEALRYYERSLALTTDLGERASLAEQAGAAALATNRADDSLAHLEAAEVLYRELDDLVGVARVSVRQADALMDLGRLEEGIDRTISRYRELDDQLGDAERASLAIIIGASYSTLTRLAEAAPWIEIAIDAAESAAAWDALARAFNVKGIQSWGMGRRVEATALMKAALELGLEHNLGTRAIVQYGNMALNHLDTDLDQALEFAGNGIAAARRIGDRRLGGFAYGALRAALLHLGRWDEVMQEDGQWIDASASVMLRAAMTYPAVCVEAWRGGDAHDAIESISEVVPDPATKSAVATCRAVVAHMRGDFETAQAESGEALSLLRDLNESEDFLISWPINIDSALLLGRVDDARAVFRIVADRPEGRIPLALRAQIQRFTARMAALDGDDQVVDKSFANAERLFEDHQSPFWLAWTMLEHAEWADGHGRHDQARQLAARAMTVFEQLQARPFIERTQALLGSPYETAVRA
jgi:class 3 adenylate cyclase/tetratricopeptide (TPR) repeat protein